jgi:hypothetical protein
VKRMKVLRACGGTTGLRREGSILRGRERRKLVEVGKKTKEASKLGAAQGLQPPTVSTFN